MNAPTNTAAFDIDSLLDSTLDDLVDMPEFKPFPVGAHRALLSMTVTTVNNNPSIDVSLEAIETVELSNPEDKPTAKGDKTNMLLMLKKNDGTKNELSEGKWKELLKPLQIHFNTSSNRETMEASKGVEVLAVTKIRADKRDKDDVKYYTDIVSIQVI